MKKILFVEDNAEYRETLQHVLEDAGYQVDAVENALQATQYFALNSYDIVISDLMMETVNGIDFLRHIKNQAPAMKTMILTAQPSMDTELEALDIYVDKYLSKETRIDVILRYIEVLLLQEKDKLPNRKQVFTILTEGIIVDVGAFKVIKNDKEINFTHKEFSVLCLLLANRGKAVSREEFLNELWDTRYETTDSRVIDMHIKAIRRKLGTQSILSIRSYGYKWD